MTKEELLSKASKLAEVSRRGLDAYRDLLNFFDSNVCIPKGANRHPYASELHPWLEGTLCEFMHNDGSFSKLVEISCLHFKAHNNNPEIRIKPKEPVYEWRYQIDTSGVCVWTACWYTDEEAIQEIKAKFPYYKKMEETKQERK